MASNTGTLFLEHVTCDLCGSGDYNTRYRKPDDWLNNNSFEYPVVECAKCGLVYVNPRPTQAAMSEFYPSDYHDGRDTEVHNNRYRAQMQFLPPITNERVLDIGCARGDFLAFLKKQFPGAITSGIDYFSTGVQHPEITFRKELLPNCGFADASFDLITAWAVFEHLHAPSIYFAEVSRILKKGGLFVFLVTNSESLYGRRAYIEDVPRHTYHFSQRTLGLYAQRYGFQVKNIFFNDEIFDGRGNGTFHYLLSRAAGSNWERIRAGRVGLPAKIMGRLGRALDKIVFSTHWEAAMRRSGVMVVQFIKK